VASDGPVIEIVPLLASACDEVRMHEIMDTWKPHTVYHAAAYKHVPLVEHNPAEGVRNNVWGTRVCAEAAARNGVRNFVLISTDKAVRPTNIMGATKRLAEMVLQALAEVNAAVVAQRGRVPSVKTTFSMVRFGNVLGQRPRSWSSRPAPWGRAAMCLCWTWVSPSRSSTWHAAWWNCRA
jgi:FlaA1/EpsC-like NDP-sugar epimerase